MSKDKYISSILNHAFFNSMISIVFVLNIFQTAAITLVNTPVHSHLDFCNSLFYGLPKYSIYCSQKVQSIVTRIVTKLQLSNLYISFQYFSILISRYVVVLTMLILLVNLFIHTYCLLINQIHILSLLFSCSPLLIPYFKKTSMGFRSFSFTASFFWNDLSNTIHSEPIYKISKKNLKANI